MLVFVTTLLGTRLASAQTMGELKGTVADAAGAPVPGALVEVTSPALIRPRQTSTDEAGRFRLPLLPPGRYAVLARLTGFHDTTVRDVKVSLGETTTLPVTLAVTAAASVEVGGARGLVDTEGTRMGLTVTDRELAALPLGRNYASAAFVVGGVGEDPLGPTFYGASSLENSYATDGLNVTGIKLGGQGKLLPIEFVREVEVRSGGYEAEYGKSLGGNINVVTKAGGNDFHGQLFGYLDTGSLAAPDQHAADRAAAGTSSLELPRQADLGLTLGGPILRDRLWFFGAYDRMTVEQPYQAVDHLVYSPAGVESVYAARTETTRRDLFAVSLSWAPAASHTLALSVFGDPGTTTGPYGVGVGVLPGPESATVIRQQTGGTDLSARWTGILGAFLGELRAGTHEERTRDSSDFADRPQLLESRLGRLQFAQGSGPMGSGATAIHGLVDETYRRNVLAAAGTLALGDHELKAGVDLELENPGRTMGISGGESIHRFLDAGGAFDFAGHVTVPRAPLDCVVKTGGATGHFGLVDLAECQAWDAARSLRSDFRNRAASAFVQDTFRPLSNLTVKAGLRYDEQRLVDTDGVTRLVSDGQWSPRLAVAWDPGGEGRARVFASAGRYYQAIPQDLQANSMSNELYAFSYNGTPGPDTVNDPFLYPFSYVCCGYFVPEGVKAPYQDEVTAGAELQVGTGWSVGARGIYRSLGRALEDRCDFYDPRSGLQGLVPVPPAPVMGCVLFNPGVGAYGQLNDPLNPDCFEDFPASTKPRPCESVHARRIYRGVEATVQGRPSRDLYVVASYVYSRLTGNYEGFVSSGEGKGGVQTRPSGNADFDYVDIVPNDSGRLLNDRTHQLKASASYSPASGLGAGLVFQLASGQPLSLYGLTDTTAAIGAYSRFLLPRGTYGEMPGTYQLDLHLQYAVRAGPATVTAVVDVFNVTDVQRALSRNQVYDTAATWKRTRPPYASPTNPLFGKDVSWQRPRMVRLGARVTF